MLCLLGSLKVAGPVDAWHGLCRCLLGYYAAAASTLTGTPSDSQTQTLPQSQITHAAAD